MVTERFNMLPVMLLFVFSLGSGCAQEKTKTSAEEQKLNYELVWSDEFENAGALDSTKWHHQTLLPMGNSWFNGEQQHYTDRIENTYVQDGALHIAARAEEYTDQGVMKNYTSARLNSKFAFTYGRVEVKAKMAMGQGVWPAIWVMGRDVRERGGYWFEEYGTKGWPDCGEIDIVEHWGDQPQTIQAALHTPSSHGNTINKKAIIAEDVGNTYHIYAAEIREDHIDFFYDDSLYYTYQPERINKKTFPYDKPKYILLNVAMGGFDRLIDPKFEQSEMIIDYVRVYE